MVEVRPRLGARRTSSATRRRRMHMTPEGRAILDVFRSKKLSAGGFIHFTDFGDAIVWASGSIRDEQTRAGLQYLIENGYVNEMAAGLELTDKGWRYLSKGEDRNRPGGASR